MFCQEIIEGNLLSQHATLCCNMRYTKLMAIFQFFSKIRKVSLICPKVVRHVLIFFQPAYVLSKIC